MQHLFDLFLGSGLCSVSLILWYVTCKVKPQSSREYTLAILALNTAFLMGLFRLVETGWLPGGVIAATWLVVGSMLSSIISLYIYFLNWRDGKTQTLEKGMVEAERIANR